MIDELKERAQHVVDVAMRLGASAADGFIREEESFSVKVRKGDVETLKEAVSRSLRLRVFLGRKVASSQTSDLSPSVVDTLVRETVEMAQLTSEDESSGLPDSSVYPRHLSDLHLVDSSWQKLRPEQRIDLARRAEASALDADASITNSDGGSFEWERSRTVLANSLGFVGAYEGTMGYVASAPIAERNGAMQQDSWFSISRFRDQLETPETVGQRAAERVLRRLGARKVSTCVVPVVFDPLTARTLVKHIFDAVSGDSIYRKRSFLVGKLGESIASEKVNLVDDALRIGGLGSRPFDDEGVGTQSTSVIEHGILRNYVHSAYTGRRLGARPTGNGIRTGSGSIAVGPTNFYLEPGEASVEDIIASVKSGLYVIELMGSGVNLVNGDYSRGATGLWIENGKLTYPVHEITIAGNLRQMLQGIDMVGNDIEFFGPVSSPSVKINSMTVSGE
jgi:PmbA protein